MKSNFLRLNLTKIALSAFNSVFSLCLLFSIRRFLLRMTGCDIGANTTFHRKVVFFCFGRLRVGESSTINYGCYIDARGGVAIGNNVNISHDVKIYTMGHSLDSPDAHTVSKAVNIDDYAWIFPNVLIMPGVNIGKGAVIYPGSVVTKSLDAYGIYAGNPARKIRERKVEPEYKAAFPVWFAI